MCRLGNTSEPGSASEVLAGPGKGMGRAGHMNGEVAAAGSGSGNDPPLCYPREGTGAAGGDCRNPGSGGGSGKLSLPVGRCQHYIACRVRLAVGPEGAADGWVPTLDCRAHGGTTQTTAGSSCVVGLGDVVLLQRIVTPGDCPSPSSERLVVEAGVWDRPVQVLLRQGLTAVTAVIGHPPAVVEVMLCAEDGSQVGKKTPEPSPGTWWSAQQPWSKTSPSTSICPERGGGGGGGGGGAVWAGMSSMEILDISTNSRSKIRFTTFGGRVAAGWYWPG